MKSKRRIFGKVLNVLLVLCLLFIPWLIGYIIKDSVSYGFIYVGYFILGNIVGTLLVMGIRFIKRR